MSAEHVNRRGERYFAFQGKTKTGKPKYFAAKRETSDKGKRIDALPEEFELFENPSNATVLVRRRKASLVLPPERDLVDRLAVKLSAFSSVQTVINGDQIVVYTPDADPAESASALSHFGVSKTATFGWVKRHALYTANLRFTLTDADERTYTAERFCYLSSIDDWILLEGPTALEPLAKKLLPHLGHESFFELM